jgi:hypothetical protein
VIPKSIVPGTTDYFFLSDTGSGVHQTWGRESCVKRRDSHIMISDYDGQTSATTEAGWIALIVPVLVNDSVWTTKSITSGVPDLNGKLHWPNDMDKSLNEAAADKIRKYRADYNNNTNAISFIPAIVSTSGRIHSEFIRILFLQSHRETDRFFAASGVQSAQSNMGVFFHFHRAVFSSILKSHVSSILAKAEALRINLNLDGAPITSKSHTHPSHSQTSRLLTSSLSLGVPVPRPTQCIRGV